MSVIKGTWQRKNSSGTMDTLKPATDISLVEGYDTAAQTKLSGNTVAQTRAWFETNNPVLRDGQYGRETGSNYIKIGDGTTAWNSLPYVCMPDGYISIEVDDGQGGYEEYGGTTMVLEVYDETQGAYVEV